MIEIKATTRRVFQFPANAALALHFYSDFRRITQFLNHISLVQEFDHSRYRLLYSTVEMAAYEVRIFADVETEIDEESLTLTVRPTTGIDRVSTKSTLRSLTAPGSYASQSKFREIGDNDCEVEYIMELGATLPRPKGLRFVPENVLNPIAENITHRRMDEIINGFIAKSLPAFLATQEKSDDLLDIANG